MERLEWLDSGKPGPSSLSAVLLFQVIYIHGILQDSSPQTARAPLWESLWCAGTDKRPLKMAAAPGRKLTQVSSLTLERWVQLWVERVFWDLKQRKEKVSKIGLKWKSDIHLNSFQLCLECLIHLNFQV